MNPIILTPAMLSTAVSLFYELKAAIRSDNPLLHHALIERGDGRLILAATDLSTAHIWCHLPRPLPLTAIQRTLSEARWAAEALRFLVPLADLREAARTARGAVTIMPGQLRVGPMPIASFPAPEVERFPAILPPLSTIAPGASRIKLSAGRVNVLATAAQW